MAEGTSRDERVARNELAFRQANESLRTVFEGAVADDQPDEAFPFLCECGERLCTEVVPVSLEAYGQVRSHPARFVILPGHKQLDSEQVVESAQGYQVVEKTGVAGELARDAWAQLSPNP
jgi:hypothetical protein